MNFWNPPINAMVGRVCLSLAAALLAALLISTFVLSLSLLLLLGQACADILGYRLNITDELKNTVLTFGAALAVAVIALYGVHRQNVSAELRHKVDASLALRKDILLEVADSTAMQYQYLLSFADGKISLAERQALLKDCVKPYYRLQAVASESTIFAMLDANEEWVKVMMEIMLIGPLPPDAPPICVLERFILIQSKVAPYLAKVCRFNVVARQEIASPFADANAYVSRMEENIERVGRLFEEIKRKFEHPEPEIRQL